MKLFLWRHYNFTMASFVRKLVSKNRRRFQEDGYDLDLSYITPNIIAMGFPAGTFLESLYRNNVTAVANLLDKKHGENYMIFNLSERKISTSIFHERVVDCGWPDHHSPPLDTLWTLCNTLHSWLSMDQRNVAVLHCKAGKGRTGTAIAAYLLFSDYNSYTTGNEPDEAARLAMSWFAEKRSTKSVGVQVPSQRRSVFQFASLLRIQREEIIVDDLEGGGGAGEREGGGEVEVDGEGGKGEGEKGKGEGEGRSER